MEYQGKPIRVNDVITGFEKLMRVHSPGYINSGYIKLYSSIDTKYPKAVFKNDDWTIEEDAALKALADGRGTERARLKTVMANLKVGDLNNVANRNQAILDIAAALKEMI